VKFWDTSALVPLLVEEPATAAAQATYRADPVVIVAWTTPIECASAIARAAYDGALDDRQAAAAFARLDELMRVSREVEPIRLLQDTARRLLRVHRLRSADAVQLASAILAAQHQPSSLAFVTLDNRLAAAARREGFDVV
jgi:predicted nucleic acid-binding protein